MKCFFREPKWVKELLSLPEQFKDFSRENIETLSTHLDTVQSPNPLVSIVIAAWNEEDNIIRCLTSIANNVTSVPFDIVVVDNNSSDSTFSIISSLGIRCYFEYKQGCGPARELGQRKAKGKYILLADADCLYPVNWISVMTKNLMKDNAVCVYGNFSFYANKTTKRWQYYFYEKLRNSMRLLRHINRPYLNAYGLNMGYVKNHGIEAGFIDQNIRGDDGRLCYKLMDYGRVLMVRSTKAVVWTGARTLLKEGTLINVLHNHILRELVNIKSYFTSSKSLATDIFGSKSATSKDYISILKKQFLSIFKR